jgi:hypothetical protein
MALFACGVICTTPGVLALGDTSMAGALLARHLRGDWGDLDDHDRAVNAAALRDGARLLSAYKTPRGEVWIITEADRSATTLLLPDEY